MNSFLRVSHFNHCSFNSVVRRFGSMESGVRTSGELKKEDLQDLMKNKIMAIRIQNFCSKDIVDHALSNLESKKVVHYSNAEGVGKIQDIGMAYFETETTEQKELYYKKCIPGIEALRAVFYPNLSPIDKVRLSLDEQWPSGASLLNLGEGSMFVGLVRSIKGEILPHEDKLERDDPSALTKIHYVSQVAFNCYLKVPKVGGELQIWNLSLNDEEYDRLRGDSYGITRDQLPPPDYTLKPEVGEFIMFNGRNLHAVTPSNESRIAASGFVLNQGVDLPLKFWS